MHTCKMSMRGESFHRVGVLVLGDQAADSCVRCPDNTMSLRGSTAVTDCKCARSAEGYAGGPCFYMCSGNSCGLTNVGQYEFTDSAMYTRQNATSLGTTPFDKLHDEV